MDGVLVVVTPRTAECEVRPQVATRRLARRGPGWLRDHDDKPSRARSFSPPQLVRSPAPPEATAPRLAKSIRARLGLGGRCDTSGAPRPSSGLRKLPLVFGAVASEGDEGAQPGDPLEDSDPVFVTTLASSSSLVEPRPRRRSGIAGQRVCRRNCRHRVRAPGRGAICLGAALMRTMAATTGPLCRPAARAAHPFGATATTDQGSFVPLSPPGNTMARALKLHAVELRLAHLPLSFSLPHGSSPKLGPRGTARSAWSPTWARAGANASRGAEPTHHESISWLTSSNASWCRRRDAHRDLDAAGLTEALREFAKGHRMAKAALEMAVLDARLRAEGVPLRSFLRGGLHGPSWRRRRHHGLRLGATAKRA